MTDLITRPAPEPEVPQPTVAAEPTPATAPAESADQPAVAVSSRSVLFIVGLWLVVGLTAMGLVLYLLEPMFQERSQRLLLEQYRSSIEKATFEAEGLAGVETPKRAVPFGTAVGIVEIGRISVQQVTVEGVSSEQTQAGPGHVPGTAGLGQPGNSAVVARRAMYGGPFRDIDTLVAGDQILVSTTLGQSVYEVDTVRQQRIVDEAPDSSSIPDGTVDPPTTSAASSTEDAGAGASNAAAAADALQTPPDSIGVDEVYGPSKDDRLTMVTSASALPTNGERATIVVARLRGKPFTPTPQNGRTDAQTGMVGDSAAWPAVLLALLGLAAAAGAAVVLYRRSTARVAYLLTAAPLTVLTVVLAEQLSRLLPAWT